MALGFLDQLRWRSPLRVPQDIKLIACDDIAEAAWKSYDITTIRQDPDAIVDAAIAALTRRLDEPEAVQPHVIIPVTLVRRRSTGVSEHS